MSDDKTPEYLKTLQAGRFEWPDAEDAPTPQAEGIDVEPRLEEIPHTFPSRLLDADAVRVIRRLTDAGHEAYLVGGCVRDLLFGLRAKDFDIVTSAMPQEIRRLFRNCRIIGRRFRLAHVFFRDKILEVATFRAPAMSAPAADEDNGGNGALLIRDDNAFGTAEQDAVRRDFSINALLYDVNRQIILDHVGGFADAEKRLVRTIGNPEIRMREDPIRMLRAVRLSARLGCTIDVETVAAIRRHTPELLEAAAPRIHEDLLRMFAGGAVAPAFDLMIETHQLQVLLPELFDHLSSAVRDGDIEELEAFRSTLRVADAWAQSGRELQPAVRFAVLLVPVLLASLDDASKRDAGSQIGEVLRPIAQRISMSKRECERIRQILVAVGRLVPRKSKKGRRSSMTALIKRAYFPDVLDFFELMTTATGDLREDAARWRERHREVTSKADSKPPKKKRSRGGRGRSREKGEKGARTG